ncbi:MAG: DUF3943 domain-containing protein [Prevotellaceae bacterium]|jgi:hypothetical protein|nr:DUF3943 domain-containing protein [Prevotellaceae bacterium]
MKIRKNILLFLFVQLFVLQIVAQDSLPIAQGDTLVKSAKPKHRFWLTSAEILGSNAGVWLFDLYALNGEYAHINWQTLNNNFLRGFTWDTDHFSTNLLGHPYQGSLYYTAARSNGYGYAAAVAFTAFGSLNWEMFMENERPSINDIFATTAGGITIGETLFRLSDLLVDNRTRGGKRFAREAAVFVISPVRGLNRLVSGKAFVAETAAGRDFGSPAVEMTVSTGARMLQLFDDKTASAGFTANLSLEYGERFTDEKQKPFDYFTLNAGVNVQKNQPFLSEITLSARIWANNLLYNSLEYLNWGVYKHYYYYDSEKISFRSKKMPYRIGAPAAFGVGFMYQNERSKNLTINSFLYFNALILGVSLSDHFKFDDRDYNFGDGFNIHAGIDFRHRMLHLSLRNESFFIFTLQAYPLDFDFQRYTPADLFAQGDNSNAFINRATLQMNVALTPHLVFTAQYAIFSRYTRYKYFDSVFSQAGEAKIMLGVKI